MNDLIIKASFMFILHNWNITGGDFLDKLSLHVIPIFLGVQVYIVQRPPAVL